MKNFLLVTTTILLALTSSFGQDISKDWLLDTSNTIASDSTATKILKDDILSLNKGAFKLNTTSGDYLFQNNLLVFYYDQPYEIVKKFKVKALTDSTLVLSQKENIYNFVVKPQTEAQTAVAEADQIIPNQGFSFTSLWRGALGMISLIIIAFLFSSNRKAIDWKIVGIGLAFQLLIAIGVLKVDFIKNAFEFIGGLFVSVLDFTRAGSKFLFEGLVVDMDTFGFIFAFQVLPTIIFFSALTSVLFYLGIIQKVVKGMAWLLSKALKISGAESLWLLGISF